MRIGIPAETRPAEIAATPETRVAATPETVTKLIALGHKVLVESNAGNNAHFLDAMYTTAGAQIVSKENVFACEMILKVRAPSPAERELIKPNTILIGMLDPFDQENANALAGKNITAFTMESIPRITRAQSMDVLSSQANIAGYKAVLVAANLYTHFFPMLMTAAGTVKAARVLVMGVGVAGLQAIATAKRLGAVIEASDVRPPVKEQVESLGAKFIDVPYLTDEEREIAQGTGGYARPMPAEWLRRQAELVHERAKLADIIITTALIPGRKAPILVQEETIKAMKPGSVIIDLATAQGGNCALSESGKIIVKHGVRIFGASDLAVLLPSDASALYARNLLDFVKLITNNTPYAHINRDDEIIAATLLCTNGQVIKKFT